MNINLFEVVVVLIVLFWIDLNLMFFLINDLIKLIKWDIEWLRWFNCYIIKMFLDDNVLRYLFNFGWVDFVFDVLLVKICLGVYLLFINVLICRFKFWLDVFIWVYFILSFIILFICWKMILWDYIKWDGFIK